MRLKCVPLRFNFASWILSFTFIPLKGYFFLILHRMHEDYMVNEKMIVWDGFEPDIWVAIAELDDDERGEKE